jgi:hypothetical protein
VPEGVTLDLTAKDAALELQDGAVLTVNGTVNATGHGKGRGSFHVGDGAAVIAGTGVINLKSKGRLLNIGGDKSRRLTLDGVTLVGLADNDSSLVEAGENSELILKSGAITGNTSSGTGGGVSIESGTFTMNGGEISGNSAIYGGGVNVNNNGTFTMSSGTIAGNSTDWVGGGVFVNDNSTFVLSGGAVSGNTAGWSGGGVKVSQNRTFTMSGGTIGGNTGGDGDGNGGGVNIMNSVFTKTGGTIYGNDAGAESNTDKANRAHAVGVDEGKPAKMRNATAGPDVNLDSGTTANWE